MYLFFIVISFTSTKMSIWDLGCRLVKIAALNVCCKCIVISWDFLSPRGCLLRSLVLNVAMLYWQLTNTLSWRSLLRLPLICKCKTNKNSKIITSTYSVHLLLKKINLNIHLCMCFYVYCLKQNLRYIKKCKLHEYVCKLVKGVLKGVDIFRNQKWLKLEHWTVLNEPNYWEQSLN